MKRIWLLGLAPIVAVPLLAGGMLDGGEQDNARLFQDVLSRVAREALDTATVDELYESAARALVASLDDPYADLFSPEELAEFSRQTLGNAYGGVGMQIEDQDGDITITRVFPNTPAERGGVRAGDRILTVAGHGVGGWSLSQVSDSLLGVPGTDVDVAFRRSGVAVPIETTFTRAVVHVPAVPFAIRLSGDVGYIPLQRFNETAAAEVAAAVVALGRDGATGFILDLRGNPGGSLDQALRIADLFLEPGDEIASVRYRNQPADVYRADGGPAKTDAPLVVLTDGYAASASEIVAGALQDHDRALLLGSTTFGKGLVQTLYPVSGGWALKLTTGKWYTPSGRSIQRDRSAAADGEADLAMDTARAGRPTFMSDGGRVVYGGGGILPDEVVLDDTITTAGADLLRSLGPHSQESYIALYEMALRLKDSVRPGFEVTPSWRQLYYEELREADVDVSRATFDAAASFVDRMIGQRVAALAFGDSAAFRRSIEHDAPVRRALELLRANQTQAQLFAATAQGDSRGD